MNQLAVILAQRIKEELKIAGSFQNGPKPQCCKCGRESSCTIFDWGEVMRVCAGCRDILMDESYNHRSGFMEYDPLTGSLSFYTQNGDLLNFLRNGQVDPGE